MKILLLFATIAFGMNVLAQRPAFSYISPDADERVRHGKNEKQNIPAFSRSYTQTLSNPALHPLALIPIYDSIYKWKWDTLTIDWAVNPYQKEINFIYDANNNKISELKQNWNDSALVNGEQYTQTYDANNNRTSYLKQTWDSSAWDNTYQNTYTYDANNNLTNELFQNWNGSAWVNTQQHTYTYDANNNMTSGFVQTWNGSVWVNNNLSTYTYDANNNKISGLTQIWNLGSWVNASQGTFNYDANSNNTSFLYKAWNGSSWVNNSRGFYTYDANSNNTSEIYHQWNGSAWDNSSKGTHTYDANNNINISIYYGGSGSTWDDNYSQYTFFYDANNIRESYNRKYINSDSIVINGDSIYYYFHTVVGVEEKTAVAGSSRQLQIYPNPANEYFFIKGNFSFPATIQLYDIFGREVMNKILYSNYERIEINTLRSGIYAYRIADQNAQMHRGKILVER